MKIFKKKEKEEIKSTFFGTIKSIFGEITAILFLGMMIIISTEFATGISGDRESTLFTDESLDDHLSPFFEYAGILEFAHELVINLMTGAFIIWGLMALLNKLFKSDANELTGETMTEKLHSLMFKLRIYTAIFTMIYFIVCIIFYFSYTSQFFD